MKRFETIDKYMTPVPHTVGEHIPLKTAQAMMSKYRFRHLPVQRGGKLVGVISDRDLKLALAFGDLSRFRVSEIMAEEPYSVRPDTPLSEVILQMVEQKIGCAIITEEGGKVIGIFTSQDGLRLFSENLEERKGEAA